MSIINVSPQYIFEKLINAYILTMLKYSKSKRRQNVTKGKEERRNVAMWIP